MSEFMGLGLFLIFYIIAPLVVGYQIFVRPIVQWWQRERENGEAEA